MIWLRRRLARSQAGAPPRSLRLFGYPVEDCEFTSDAVDGLDKHIRYSGDRALSPYESADNVGGPQLQVSVQFAHVDTVNINNAAG